jgi:hypothetical protein
MLHRYKIIILSWLLHHANRSTKRIDFYLLKNRLLKQYGITNGYDVQFIEGKECHACDGSGIYVGYSWHTDEPFSCSCNRCYNGWYKRPSWVLLERLRFSNYVFHQPKGKYYSKEELPPVFPATVTVEGYIEHKRSKYGVFSICILFILFDYKCFRSFLKECGTGWRIYWYQPRNWFYVFAHFYKHGFNSYPLRPIKEKIKGGFQRKRKDVCFESSNGEELPF